MHIARLSPITIGFLVLSLVVLGAAVLVLSRSRHRAATPAELVAETETGDRARDTTTAPPADRLARAPVGATRPRIEENAAATPPAPPATDGGDHAVDDKVAVKNRQLLVAAHNLQLIVQADEQAFEVLKLPDDQRVAIRRISEEFGRRARDDLSASQTTVDEQIGLGIARNDQAERDRRAAIKALLGPEGATAFSTAEYAEARRLRIRYRKQWAEELDSAAPWPEGVPRSAH